MPVPYTQLSSIDDNSMRKKFFIYIWYSNADIEIADSLSRQQAIHLMYNIEQGVLSNK